MNIVVVPSLKSDLLSSTAIVPTQHKGGLGMVIAIAAMVIIPYAAPLIAGAIGTSLGISAATFGLSAAMGSAIGSAMVGAALGAGVALITGGNVGLGAIGGAIGGGIGGYTSAAGAAAGAGGAAGGSGTAGVAGTGAGVAPATAPTAVMAGGDVGIGAGGGLATGGAESFVASPYAGGTFVTGGVDAASSAGAQLSGASAAPAASSPAGGAMAASGTQGYTNPSFLDTLGTNLMSSEALQNAGGKLLTTAVTNGVMGDPNMTAEEKANLAALNKARAFEKDQLDKKAAESTKYLNYAANINPDYYGQQALTEEQNRLLRAQQAGLREINPSDTGSYSAQTRRNALDKSRLSGYDRGRQEAEAKRLQYMQAAQGTAPSGAGYAAGVAGDLASADARYQRAQKEASDYASMFSPIAEDIFGSTEKKKLQEQGVA